MKFWYINFEGMFTKESSEYPNEPFFSGCLIQAEKFTDAEFKFLQALTERKINLIKIEENFPIEPNELDLEDDQNIFWIEWCEEVEMTKKPTFDTFNLYPLEEIDNENANEH